ncbi:RsiV family protein [Mycolicibacter engbaekii]|uniref:RsiV family protein n=1 Tax=Mycolicibacter engbaekii TaxID=188915 RepID=UPI001F24E845|nr:RsiV family protein [Mycolicibacter engbaekii]
MSESGPGPLWRRMLPVLLAAGLALLSPAPALADPASGGAGYAVIPARLTGTSPNELGTWTVDYERIAGGDPAITDPINQILDDEAAGQIATYVASSSHTTPWTFRTQGRLLFRPVTVSALFDGEYNAVELPNMPYKTVATRVFDARSGIQIVWENLFVDRQAGLRRLSELTKKILPSVYPAPLGGWAEYGPGMAPLERNFRAWIPTAQGIELHFPEYQVGRGLHVITIPWPAVIDLIAPEFVPITN